MPEMDRRSMMLMTGIGLLGAAISAPQAWANPSRPQAPADPVSPAQPPDAANRTLLVNDEFDGPLGTPPDPARWTVQTWDDPVEPRLLGHYRNDPRNVFLDGNSNLVLCATQEGPNYFSGRVNGNWKGRIGTTWEARIKL